MLNRLQDVFRSFQQYDVKYVVIGGTASVLHGVPRATLLPPLSSGLLLSEDWVVHGKSALAFPVTYRFLKFTNLLLRL